MDTGAGGAAGAASAAFESRPVDLDQRFEDSSLRSRPELIADAVRLVGL